MLTVTARDAAGNTSTDTLTVTYTPADTTLPVATITGPTSAATFATATTPLTLSGTASDNVGVTQVTWANDRAWQRDGDGDDELVGERDRAVERRERVDGDGARCGR